MAINGALSLGGKDFNGQSWSADYPFVNTSNLFADIQVWASGIAGAGGIIGAIDAVIDSKIETMVVTLAITPPTTLKAAAVAPGRNIENGAMKFFPVGLPNLASLDLPSINAAFVSGKTLVRAGALDTLITYILAQHASTNNADRYRNLLASYKSGRFSPRKRK